MKVSEFFLNEAVDYASYSTLRMIASAIDGQKNTSRKVLYTILEKNIKEEIKVSVLDNTAQGFTEFLHGTMYGPIVTLAQNFSGSNNLNLLSPEGNFGSRFINDAAAARYIYSCGSDILFKSFDIRDVLVNQEFEGSKIEPLFYVPNLPFLLINGSSGVASGFKQSILPRNPTECVKYILGKESDLTPWFKDFSGKVYQGETNLQWIIEGSIRRLSKNTIRITELPIGYNYKSYITVLDKLEESKTLKYVDLCNANTSKFEFEVKFTKNIDKLDDSDIIEILKLRKKVSETLNALDENNRVQTFNSVTEILDYYKSVRLKYQGLQKIFDLNNFNTNREILESKIKFLTLIINNKLIIYKKSKKEIISELETLDLYNKNGYEYLLNMSIHSFTLETLTKLETDLENLKQKIKILESKTELDLWKDSLSNLKGLLC